VLERLRRLLANPWVQRAILAAVIVWVFWDGIWSGVPRSDQVQYLHQVSQFDSLWDILSHSPSWNRTMPTGGDDYILYRPILYLLLGTFYYLFRYNFVAWQIAGLSLHIAVALGLHLLLIQGRLKHTLFPLMIALLFATGFFASELVLWNHIVGYVLFCVLDVYAVYFFLHYLQSDRRADLVICGALSLVAEFTYEAGAIVNLLFAATLFARSLSLTQSHRKIDRRSALLFLLAALLLPTVSVIDLRAKGLVFSPRLHGMEVSRMILLASEAAVLQIGFWLSTWLAPTIYHCSALGRAICGVSRSGLSILRLLNLVALALLAVAGILGSKRLRRSSVPLREPMFALVLCAIFLFGYAMIIAIGRSVPKGLAYVLQANIYYSYIANLTVCIGVAAAAVVGPARAASVNVEPDRDPASPETKPLATGRRLEVGRRVFLALTLLVIANASGVRYLARAYRYDFAASRQDVIDRLLAWRKQVGDRTQRYFVVSPTCGGNETFWWFDDIRLRRDSGWRPPVTLADALWPDWSANLNAARIHIPPESVDEISCDKPIAGR